MAAIKPLINIEYIGKATIVRFTDERILEQKRHSKPPGFDTAYDRIRVRRDQAHFRLWQRPISLLRYFGTLNTHQHKDLRKRRPSAAL